MFTTFPCHCLHLHIAFVFFHLRFILPLFHPGSHFFHHPVAFVFFHFCFILPLFFTTFTSSWVTSFPPSYCLCFLPASLHPGRVTIFPTMIWSQPTFWPGQTCRMSDMANIFYRLVWKAIVFCFIIIINMRTRAWGMIRERTKSPPWPPPPSNLLGIISSATILPNNRAALASGNFTNPSTMRPVIAGARRLKVETMNKGRRWERKWIRERRMRESKIVWELQCSKFHLCVLSNVWHRVVSACKELPLIQCIAMHQMVQLSQRETWESWVVPSSISTVVQYVSVSQSYGRFSRSGEMQ